MNANTEQLKKKILYRANYRGTKEMDKLLFAFVSKYLNNIDESSLINLEKFLDIDDEDLYKFYNGEKKTLNFKDEFILNLFKNFKI